MTRILDGKALAQTMQAEIAARVATFTHQTGARPGLAAVLVGDHPASLSQAELLQQVQQLNHDPQVNGILVQLPLPRQIDENAVIHAVAPLKDVDGFGSESLGLLTAGHPRFLPCTPFGIQQLLVRNNIRIDGQHVVIVGRSNIVGKPLSLLLMQKAEGANATVTVCHSRSRDLGALTRQADIVVVAIGQTSFLKKDMVRPGAVVVDVGTNRTPEGKWAGDVDFETVKEIASAITPVPGGVGPMTITMLLHNTLQAAILQQK